MRVKSEHLGRVINNRLQRQLLVISGQWLAIGAQTYKATSGPLCQCCVPERRLPENRLKGGGRNMVRTADPTVSPIGNCPLSGSVSVDGLKKESVCWNFTEESDGGSGTQAHCLFECRAQREELERISRSQNVSAAQARRARILLLSDADHGDGRRPDWQIAELVGLTEKQVKRIRQQFVREGPLL